MPYGLLVSMEKDGRRIEGHIVRIHEDENGCRYDVLESEDTLEHGTLHENVPEGCIHEEELWEDSGLPYQSEERWNPAMPWWQPDVKCASCGTWANARFTKKMGDGRQLCPECAKEHTRSRFWRHENGGRQS